MGQERKPGKKRLQFDFTEEVLAEIDELQRVTGLPSRAELIRHSLRFMQWAMEETTKKRAELLIERNGVIRGVCFPFWKQLQQNRVPGEDIALLR